jgi:hypothetical protein
MGGSLLVESMDSDDVLVGDLVVIMTEPGPFRVVAVQGADVVIEGPNGATRKVREIAVRKIDREPPVQR